MPFISYANLHTNFCARIFAYGLLRTNVCNTYFCRTYLILYIHLLTNICIRILTRVRTLHLRYFCKRTFVYEFLHAHFRVRTFAYVLLTYLRILYPTYVHLLTNICIRTFAYVLLACVLFTVRTFANVHLHTNFCVRTFAVRILYHTYFCIRTFAYEHLRTYFCPFCPTYLTRHRLCCFCTHHSLGGGVGSDPPCYLENGWT